MKIDINVTSTCNLGCAYCSEGHNPLVPDKSIIENSQTKVSKEEINTFISRMKNEKPDEQVDISWWGGEPMINFKLCSDVMIEHRDDKQVTFFFYTNGMYIERYKNELKNINSLLGKTEKGEPRLIIQISYDGIGSNSVERLTKGGKDTSETVKQAFNTLGDIGIARAIKSTITPRTFKYIYENYIDIMSMEGTHNYFPTPDSYSDFYKEEPFMDYMVDLKKGLMKIAKHIIDNNLRPDTFAWFANNKALCQAGINYYGMNLDGTLSPCHSTMYDETKVHEIGNINDEDIFSKLDGSSTKYSDSLESMNDDCVGCDVLFCMKCPAGSYTLDSNKETAEYKISDFTANPKGLSKYMLQWTSKNISMCSTFKISDEVYKALLYAKQQKEK